MDWSTHYPAFVDHNVVDAGAPVKTENESQPSKTLSTNVTIADIGCGFGGLLFALSPLLPDKLILGMEIRTHVTSFVQDKIAAMRKQSLAPETAAPARVDDTTQHTSLAKQPYQNISCIRANTMKFLPNFFSKAQLTHIFLCFPDPHFKLRKHKARIVSATLNSEYAFVLAPGGRVYTITDVKDLHLWMAGHFDTHPSFRRVTDTELTGDACVAAMLVETEEGKKVDRNNGEKFVAVYERLPNQDYPP